MHCYLHPYSGAPTQWEAWGNQSMQQVWPAVTLPMMLHRLLTLRRPLSMVCCQVIYRRPRQLSPWGFHQSTWLASLSGGSLSVCPSQLWWWYLQMVGSTINTYRWRDLPSTLTDGRSTINTYRWWVYHQLLQMVGSTINSYRFTINTYRWWGLPSTLTDGGVYHQLLQMVGSTINSYRWWGLPSTLTDGGVCHQLLQTVGSTINSYRWWGLPSTPTLLQCKHHPVQQQHLWQC